MKVALNYTPTDFFRNVRASSNFGLFQFFKKEGIIRLSYFKIEVREHD